MRLLPTRSVALVASISLGFLAAVVGVASFPWHGPRKATAPKVELSSQGKGPLTAGAGEAPIEVPPGTAIGGFARLSYDSNGRRDPTLARALVLQAGGRRYAIASAEILLVPEALEDSVRARLFDVPLDGLVLAATHTHAGPGAYWEDFLGEALATGRYDPKIRDAVASAIAKAIRSAATGLAPARLAVATGRAESLVVNRAGGDKDARLVSVRVERPDGSAVGEVVVFAAHPTTLGQKNRSLSGDWPGRLAQDGKRGVRLVFQGALGDQSVSLDPPGTEITPENYAAGLGAAVDALSAGPPETAPSLGYARVSVGLPTPDPAAVPRFLRPALRNLAWDGLPGEVKVEALRLGPVVLACIPAEPTAAVGEAWREAAGPGVELVSLAGGYAGYVDTALKTARREGEAKRTYYGPGLAAQLGEAVVLATEAARNGKPAAAAKR